MEGHYLHLIKRVKGKNLICIQDTTEYNFNHHKHRIRTGQLGTISDNQSLGLRVHPMLVLGEEGFPYGLSSVQVINRASSSNTRHDRRYQSQPIEQKESYRWIKAIEDTKRRLSMAQSLTIVADRESDIYQLWSRMPDASTHLVIRTPFKRKFLDADHQEVTPTSSPSMLGSYQLHVPGRLGKTDKARMAQLDIFCQHAYTVKPKGLRKQTGNTDAPAIPLFIVTAHENVPKGVPIKEPIEWILLTDKKVSTLAEALQIVSLYKSRWNIEQLFRLTKQKGFAIEESQLETAHGLKNLIALVFIAAIRIYQMVKCRNDQHRQVDDIFDQQEQKILKKINPTLEGNSEKSKNNNPPNSLAYFVWIVARLGNWKPEDRDPPGPITLKRGWNAFQNYLSISHLFPP